MPEPVRIRDADLLNVIHRAKQIDDLLVTPVGEDRFLIRAAPPAAPAVVHAHHDVAVRREDLPLEAERDARPDRSVRRECATASDTSALACSVGGFTIRPCTSVPSLLVDVKSSVVPSRSWDIHVVVLVRQPAQLAVLERVTSGISVSRRRQDRERAVGIRRQIRDDSRAADEALDLARRSPGARRILRPVVRRPGRSTWNRLRTRTATRRRDRAIPRRASAGRPPPG